MDRGGLRAAHGAGGLQADGVTQDGIGTPGQVEVMGNGMISLRNLRATTGRLSWMNGRDLADPDLAIITDASPQGVGAILCYVNLAKGELVPWAAMEAPVRKEDADWLALEFGEASSQGALEAWAVLLAVRMWKTGLRGVPLLVKSGSTAELAIAQKLSSPSPTVNWVGAELALRLEVLDVPQLIVHHLPGRFNVEADWLSERSAEVPWTLRGIKIQKFEGEARRKSQVPPPGIAPQLGCGGASNLRPICRLLRAFNRSAAGKKGAEGLKASQLREFTCLGFLF